ncbi:hypothetical protein D6779_05485 [Candidatus Parcubacteria bacterium]|nr:MAG: hypothetical protein D6779_05485 [Candidatus Parcubacteria bacterium]
MRALAIAFLLLITVGFAAVMEYGAQREERRASISQKAQTQKWRAAAIINTCGIIWLVAQLNNTYSFLLTTAAMGCAWIGILIAQRERLQG